MAPSVGFRGANFAYQALQLLSRMTLINLFICGHCHTGLSSVNTRVLPKQQQEQVLC